MNIDLLDPAHTLSTRSLQAFLALSAYTVLVNVYLLLQMTSRRYLICLYNIMSLQHTVHDQIHFNGKSDVLMYTVAARVFAGLQIWIRAHSYDFSRSESIKPGIG